MNPIMIDERLHNRVIVNSHPDVRRFIEYSNISRYRDITQEGLTAFFQTHTTAFWDVIRILGLLGVQFRGKLERFSSLAFEEEENFLVFNSEHKQSFPSEVVLPFKMERFLRTFLQSYGLLRIEDFHGLYLPNLRHQLEKTSLSDWCESFVETLLEQGFSVGPLVQTAAKSEQPSPSEEVKIVTFENERIVIPESMWERNLENDFSTSVGRNVYFLRKDGFTTYGKLPNDLYDYFRHKSQVGAGKIRKFKEELGALVGRYAGQQHEAMACLEKEKVIVRKIYVPSWLRNTDVDAYKELGSKNNAYLAFIDVCYSHRIRVFGDLSRYTLDELKTLLTRPHARVNKMLRVLEKLYIRLDGEEQEPMLGERWVLFRHDLSRLLHNERIDEIEEDLWEILHLRMDKGSFGEELTLQQIAERKGITRERIRQIEVKAFSEYIFRHVPLLIEIQDTVRQRNELVPLHVLFQSDHDLSEPEGALLQSVIKKCDLDLKYDHDYQCFFTSDILRIDEEIKHFLTEITREQQWFEPTMLQLKCNTYFEKNDSNTLLKPEMIQKNIIDKYFISYRSLYFPSRGSKKELLLPLFEAFFPHGLAIIKNAAEFTNIARELYPDKFVDNEDRAIIASLLRNEEEVLIWDNGYYVPRKSIAVSRDKLLRMRDWTVQLLRDSQAPQIRLTRTLWHFKDDLERLGITNEYALYTCFKLFFSDDFDFVKAPRICLKGQLEVANQPLTRIFYDFMKQQRRKVSRKEILEHFRDQLGWETYHIEQRMGEEIIRVGFDEYIHIDNLQVNEQGLEMVKNWLVKKLRTNESEIVSVKIVNRAIMKLANVDSYQSLYYLLEREYPDVFSFYIYPKIGLFDVEEELHASARRSKLAILEVKMASEKRIFYRSELETYFKSIGWDNREFALITSRPGNLLVYDFSKNQTWSYVHKDSIGWSEEKQEALLTTIHDHIDCLHEQNRFLLDLHQVVDDAELMSRIPRLENGIDWTPDLMVSLLKYGDDRLNLLGLSQKLFVREDNPHGIANEMDLIYYVLVSEFGGATSLRQMENRLQELHLIERNMSKLYLNDEMDEDMPYVTTPTLEIMTHELYRMRG
ncbi:sigma factor-like helix-turn-helix DNA-binding protein [Paenibacillus xylaniclasticus]|uniref:sigma factor-like helix-turn-helix DNA-binding protein n=1 Tax=Paenibacillus xylaniclasticus TaxID=588083 RepID=UPI0013E0C793|nr:MULTISPECIES: sigma factor-like helix-turn-helix DNA-binding protein [Paenibacillus]GFN30440.1 hypothetical protein PCURB6_07000 [Paenibacillus curdlanolyticus]